MKNVIYTLMALAVALSVCSCRVSDEPELMSQPLQQGTFEMGLQEGTTIKLGYNNLFSISTDYPNLKVSSNFGNVTVPPRIKYMGQFDFLNTIPIRLDEPVVNESVEIVDSGGYLIRLSVYDPSQKSEGQLFVRMRIKEKLGPTQKESSLAIEYQIYATKSNLIWKLPI